MTVTKRSQEQGRSSRQDGRARAAPHLRGCSRPTRNPSLLLGLLDRYLLKNAHGRVVESLLEMFKRVAGAVAKAESAYGVAEPDVAGVASQFFRLMAARRFLPNSPTLMNAGRKDGMLSACFVLPVEDSIEGIFDSVKDAALIQKAGGGTGFAFDRLRPTGDLVASSGGRTSGPLSYMNIFATATEAIQQGSFRRGANMGMMSVEHPDIPKFIMLKRSAGGFENFNLSVKVTDAFMRALRQRPDVPLVPRPRPHVTEGRTYKFRMGCGTLFVGVNRDGQGPCEVFANLGKAGGCPSQSEATCRAVSAALRSGVDPRVLVEQLKGIRCLSTWAARQANRGVEVLSCPDAIARAIEEFLDGASDRPASQQPPVGRACPVCRRPVRREAGCFVCEYCGWNGCG